MEQIQRRGYEHKLIEELKNQGQEYEEAYIEEAQARTEYARLKTEEVLKLKFSGESATNINNIVRGMPGVNEAMLRYNIAQAKRKAMEEKINITKMQIKALGMDY